MALAILNSAERSDAVQEALRASDLEGATGRLRFGANGASNDRETNNVPLVTFNWVLAGNEIDADPERVVLRPVFLIRSANDTDAERLRPARWASGRLTPPEDNVRAFLEEQAAQARRADRHRKTLGIVVPVGPTLAGVLLLGLSKSWRQIKEIRDLARYRCAPSSS